MTAPAKWKLKANKNRPKSAAKAVKSSPRAAGKNAAPEPQTCEVEAANLRPITRNTEQLIKKEQQTAFEKNKTETENLALAQSKSCERVAVVVEKNLDSVETQKTPNQNEARVRAALERHDFAPRMAERLMVKHGIEACEYQLQRLSQQRNVETPTGWLIRALQRDDRDAVAGVAVATPQPSVEESAEDKAERAARLKARMERMEAAAAQVLAGVDWARQVYLRRCMEYEGLSLVEVIEREEHYALSRWLSRGMSS